MDFIFKNDYSFIFIIISVCLAGIISYFYYRRSRLEGFQKKNFSALRFLSLLFIFLLLSSPVISFLKGTSNEPVNVFLLDNSQSLLIDNRAEYFKNALDKKINVSPSGSKNVYYLFSNKIKEEVSVSEIDTITFEGINNFRTNLTNSLSSLREKLSTANLSAVTIVSDGMINEGGNSVSIAKSLGVPVNYILIGDTIQKNDLVVKNIFYNKSAFIESSVPVKFELNSYNYDRNVKINIYEEDKLIETKDISVNRNQTIYDLSFNVVSATERIAKYKIEAQGIDDEITLKNNFQEIFIKFVNNRFKILVLAGAPSADFAFISSELKKIKNFELTFLTQKSATEFYEGNFPGTGNFDSYIFVGFPTVITPQNIINTIHDDLIRNNASLIFFAGRNVDHKKLTVLEDNLPFKIISLSENEEETGIKPVSTINNEAFRETNILSSVNSFPNIFKTVSVFSANPSSETFLVMSKNSEPALIIENTARNKSAAFLAYGLFKWRLTKSKNNAGDVLNYILANTIVSITNKEEKKTFAIETTMPVYSKYENVKFEARITNFDPAGGEQIKVEFKGNGLNTGLELTRKENRYYEGEINVPSDGNYDYTARLYSENNLVESINGKFAIGENNFEFRTTRASNALLNVVANETGGSDFTNSGSGEISDSLKAFNNKSKSEITTRSNFEFNINPYALAILIFLLCLEWFLRKRYSLP